MLKKRTFVAGLICLAVMLSAIAVPFVAAAAEPEKVVMLWDYRAGYKDWQKAMADEFNATHSNIQIELVLNTGDTTGKILSMVAGGVQLDIANHDAYMVNTWGMDGMIEDLTPYMAKDKQHFANWYPSSLQLFSTYGNQWALPRDIQLAGIFYNVDAYKEAGLALPRGKWTYEDLQKNALKLRKEDENGKVSRWGWKFPTWRNWVTMIWAYGADFVDNWNVPTKFTGQTSEMTQALQYIQDLETSGAIIDQQNDPLYNYSVAFSSQRSAMVQTNTLAMEAYTPIRTFEWDVAPLPYGPGGRSQFLNSIGWFMLADSKHKDAAWEVMKFFTGPVADEALVDQIGMVPADRRYITRWIQANSQPASRQFFFEDLDSARAPGTLDGTTFNYIQNEVNQVRFGEKSISAALENMKTLVEGRIAEMNAD